MGRLEKEGVVFWSLPDGEYCEDLSHRMSEGVLTEKVEHFQEGVKRDITEPASGEAEE